MGLDLMVFTMAIEEAFEIRFPDEDMLAITTPRKLIDYVIARVPKANADVCLSQRAFYRLRSSLVGQIGCSHSALRPDTPLLALIPIAERDAIWDRVRQDIGLANSKRWTRLAERGWFDLFREPRIGTLRDAVAFVVTRHAVVAKGRDAGWTREQVAEVVHGLMREDLGINFECDEYTDDMRWQEDMGIC